MSDPQLLAIEGIVRNAIKAGNDVHQIRSEYGTLFPIAILDKALTNVKAKLDKNYHLVDPQIIAREGLIGEKFRWYGGPHELSERWEFAKQQL